MAQLLETKHARLAATLDGSYPQLQKTVWQSDETVQAAVQTLVPQMSENKIKVRPFSSYLCHPFANTAVQTLGALQEVTIVTWILHR